MSGANFSDPAQPAPGPPSAGSAHSRTTCPLCGSDSTLAFYKDGFPVRDCAGCGHRFAGIVPASTHVEEVYGDDYFHGGGAGYPDYLAEAQLLTASGRRYGRLLKRFARPGRLLDVGAAAGFVLDGLCREGWDGEGVEPNRRMAEHAGQELGRTVHVGTVEDFESPRVASASLRQPWAVGHNAFGVEKPLFSAVSYIQVLAHLPDPMETFRAADALTRPGGHWLVETWNAGSRTARLLGPAWHEYSPPSVMHWWTPAVLRRTLAPLGYRLRGTGFAQKWIGLGHARSLLEHKYGDGAVSRLARLLPPHRAVPYPSEDLFWAVYQKM